MKTSAVDPRPQAGLAAAGTGPGFRPARILDVELTHPLPQVPGGEPYRRVWVLARLHTEPLGLCEAALPAEGLLPGQLAALLWRDLGPAIAARFDDAGQQPPVSLTADGLPVGELAAGGLAASGLAVGGLAVGGLAADPGTWPPARRRAVILAGAPPISVVVCTRDRPAQLETCLERLRRQEYPRFDVVVVDNAPGTGVVERLVERLTDGPARFRYCAEPRPGLSWARNAGIAAADGDILAFLDDDDEPDQHWLAGIAAGFARDGAIGCVAGLILPARLDTAAEELFEQQGGHRLGRGFAPETFTRAGPQSPLFPLPPFGTGANMAFRRETLVRIGGFDVALGAGTRTFACEDTLAFTLALLSGYDIAYEPSALMWHHHRPDMDSLGRQLHGYSIGLTAFYAALLRHRPGVLPALLRLVPAAGRYLREGAAPQADPDLLAELDRRHLQGLALGPLAYLRSAYEQSRAARSRRYARV
jgi:GT2 family glycosyltransferase